MLVVSERTVYRRMGSFSIRNYNVYHQFLIDEDLDFTLSETAKDYQILKKKTHTF